MKTLAVSTFWVIISVFIYACVGPRNTPAPPQENSSAKTVYLVSQSWHAGIVIERNNIPSDIWPGNNFPDSKYLEVGWGDRVYYQGRDRHFGHTIMAVIWPTTSVLHVAGFNSPIKDFFPTSEIIEIKLSGSGFDRLCRYIADSFDRDEKANLMPVGIGKYGDSQFYLSREKYHLFKTCNVWTAKALRSAGCPITPVWAITVENLMAQARKFGTVIQPEATVCSVADKAEKEETRRVIKVGTTP